MEPGGMCVTMGWICRELNCGRFKTERATKARVESAPNWLDDVKCRKHDSTLFHCPSSSWSQNNCDRSSEVTHITCSDYMPIRLRGGEEICSGRLEVYHNAEWGSICADLWDIRDAQVICRQLGCGPALSANRRAVDGSGGGTIWMNRVKCRGNEIHLWDCPHSLKIHTGCSQSAGVTCADIFVTLPFSSETTTTYTTVPAQLTEKKTVPPSKNLSSNFPYIYPVSLLVLGSVLFLALVLLVVLFYQNRVLRRVISKARRKTLLEAVYEEINHKCVTNRYTKRGSFISEDQHSGYEDVDEELLSENYGEVYDDIIPAEESPHITTDSVRLVDGGSRCAGRVEVLHRGHWGTVCDDYWDMRDAAVVCRELGCGEAIDAPRRARFGSGSGPIWVEYANCAGSESSLKNCRSYDWGRQRCNHDEDAGAVCAEVRLVGRSHCSGRVEVLHGESWVTVCDADFDQQGAEVVCRELGCGSPVEVLGAAAFGRGEGQVCLEELQCRGRESQIHFCPKSSSLKHNCSHDNDVGLVCADSVRLVDGGHRCAGRVEFFYNRTWRSVCGKNWDIRDAAVVCRELGCGEAVFKNVQFGPRSAWMDDVNCSGSESSVKHCRSAGWVEQICNRLAGVICSGVRLVGRSRCSGRVEVLHGESWVTVCDADFDQQGAEVVCRELGCGSPVEVLGAAAFGRGEGQVWSEELQCRGNESHMYLCQTSPSLKPNCSHNKDVGLRCSGHTQARLMNGSDSCSGRVELQYLSEWGTVCDVSWDMRAASVLCAQLKCGSAVAVLGSDWFGEGSGRIWADVFDCQGNETHLLKCPISSWSRTACSHEQYAGVICSGSSLASHEGGVRLSGGMECEGEVEVFFRQDWRRVLLDSWSESEASVVCRQLGYGSVLNISSSSSSSPEHSYMCVTGFNCSGSEAHLRNCSSSQAVNCSSTVQLYITCSGTSNTVHSSIRLVGSGGDCAGRLEVFHSGSWGTVSDELWDIEDAQVVCRQLQCGVALSAPVPVPARFGSGTGPIWLNEVECEGNEASLWNCRYQLCGEDECGHKDDVGVVCSEYKEIRLTEGCEGNLEVYCNGTWGNVCVNGMTDETAKLICRELNCGRTGSESWSKARVESAPNWLDNGKCRKHDSTLWHCPSSSWGENRCDNRNEVACITCSENGNTLDLTNWLCDSSPHERPCSKHIPLRLRGGVGSCSGWLQVYHNKTWGSVCGDLWDIRDAQVICRQLGCGPALSANRRAADGSGGGTIWMNRVKCRGNEIHLWDCPHSLKNHTDCSHSAGVTCGGFLYHTLPLNNKRGQMGHFVLQDSQPQTRRIILPQTPPPAVPSIYPVSLLVLGSVLFLALVLLVVLFYQNRVLRRVISKRRKTSAEPVYEEIDTRLIPKRITVSTERW
ncbi:scavenger receptor cysteine-rich type 1 protein M130-like isoform X2 [Astyanax mexicanus]|uniref:scavenger receptor cysteine-rich type 1 protein M130-like isoform X2 n=1 Tax=Astyanax mexicanus TaxID=7994 RepID=UPI0020CB6406|nr:scavenger receptor cysteine-rich type 1 protein M130-like isoform X2 [Astyanax mexicanus]XP_049331109.1 scavenger receptor cysteine-rich type 1 protein M130-like isoform X2 [Astyanax mexicanus]XP_049331110.1 scavenger receptor cysteine-rich type 1 protein M130-like isoform X2 [Astyanax mexicanus]XP_049331111.1 scavenger receptor cysteine-rich type 1 protein M130-like isoform X2 [Astyanax mexicanus]XP_049331112.1 scavenger receptor cysteine-rich type 1 protein M130-like isoform X2 [Astyanax m